MDNNSEDLNFEDMGLIAMPTGIIPNSPSNLHTNAPANEHSKLDDEEAKKLLERKSETISEYNNKNGGCYLYKKVMHVLSLLFLLNGCLIPMVYYLAKSNFTELYRDFQTRNEHFQITFEVFVALFVSLILLIIRLLSAHPDKDYVDQISYRKIIKNKLGHSFYIGNFITLAFLASWSNFHCQYYFVTPAVGFIASLCYYIVYSSDPIGNIITGWYNSFCLKMPISFLLAWVNCLTLTSMFMSIEKHEDVSLTATEWISFIDHTMLFIFVVLVLAYHKDLYYPLLIILFQAGIIISNRNKYSKENKFTLVFGILSTLCVIFAWFCVKDPEEKNKEELVQIMDHARVKV